MALIKCPECGRNNVSDKADACPNCGYPICEINKLNNIDFIPDHIVDNGKHVETTTVNSSYKTSENKSLSKSNYYIIAVVSIILMCLLSYYSITRCSYPGCFRKRIKSGNYCINHYTQFFSYSNNDKDAVYTDTNYYHGNEGALNQAEAYLRTSAFSYTGLIKQLEYEGFTESEAKYGADNCGADWYEQAVRQAESYLNTSSFSYSGLLEQLEYEGFTETEARYGVDNCGADWYEQAIKSAKSYRKSCNLSGSRLVEQLEYAGFSKEEAEYGEKYSQ